MLRVYLFVSAGSIRKAESVSKCSECTSNLLVNAESPLVSADYIGEWTIN